MGGSDAEVARALMDRIREQWPQGGVLLDHVETQVAFFLGAIRDAAIVAERERCAAVCEHLAIMHELGAGESPPGQRLRQAERMIRAGESVERRWRRA